MVNTVKIGNYSLALYITKKEKEGWIMAFREHHCRYRGMRDFANLFDAVFYRQKKGKYELLFGQSKTNGGITRKDKDKMTIFARRVKGYGIVELSDYNTKTKKLTITVFPIKK